jgi:hypothetical protein
MMYQRPAFVSGNSGKQALRHGFRRGIRPPGGGNITPEQGQEHFLDFISRRNYSIKTYGISIAKGNTMWKTAIKGTMPENSDERE